MFALLVVPTGGEPVRELLRLPQPQTWGSAHTAEWTPDSQAVLVVSEQRGEGRAFARPDGRFVATKARYRRQHLDRRI